MSALNYSVGSDPDAGDSGATYDSAIGATLAELANRSGRLQISGTIINPAAQAYKLIQNTRWPFTVVSATLQTDAGTLTAALKIDSTAVTSVSAVAVTSAESTTAATANKDAATGADLSLTPSSISGVGALYFNIWIDRTGAGTA